MPVPPCAGTKVARARVPLDAARPHHRRACATWSRGRGGGGGILFHRLFHAAAAAAARSHMSMAAVLTSHVAAYGLTTTSTKALDRMAALFEGNEAAPEKVAARYREVQEAEAYEAAVATAEERAAAVVEAQERARATGSEEERVDDGADDERGADDGDEGGIVQAKRARVRDSAALAKKLSKKQKKARREGAPQPAATAAPCGGPTDALLGALALGPGGVTRGSDAGTNKRKARDADKGAGRRGGAPATLAALEAGLASGPKAGKRSHAFPRSGNRTASFK